MKLSLLEQETIINYNGEEKTVYISTAFTPDIEYYDKLCETNPEFIKKVKDGDPYKEYEIEKRYSVVRLRPPRQMSDEQKKANAERLKNSRANKTPGNVGK